MYYNNILSTNESSSAVSALRRFYSIVPRILSMLRKRFPSMIPERFLYSVLRVSVSFSSPSVAAVCLNSFFPWVHKVKNNYTIFKDSVTHH